MALKRQQRPGSSTSTVGTQDKKVHQPYSGKTIGGGSFSTHAVYSPEAVELQDTVDKAIKTAIANTETSKQRGFFSKVGSFAKAVGFQTPVKFLSMAGGFVTDIGQAIAEPVEAISIPDKIDWVSVATILDELIALTPTPNGVPHTGGILTSMGYPQPQSLFETTAMKVSASLDNILSRDNPNETQEDRNKRYEDEINAIETWRSDGMAAVAKKRNEEKAQGIDRTTQIPLMHGAKEWWEGMQDGQPSWFLSKAFDVSGDWIREQGENVGQIKTGSNAADYLINGTIDLTGSIAGSMIPAIGQAKLAQMGVKALNTAGKIKAATLLEKAAEASIAITGTMGESLQVAEQEYDNIVTQRIQQIGGEAYIKAQHDYVNNKVMENLVLPREGQGGVSEQQIENAQRQYMREFEDQWIAEHPKEYEGIKKNALLGYQAAIRVNTANIFLNKLSASMYMRGRVPTRNILKKPSRWDDVVRAGHYEGLEEVVNTVAGKAAQAKGMGKEYYLGQMLDDVFSMEAAESYAWGFAGGAGEGGITNFRNHKLRMQQFEEQQKEIAKQDKIGSGSVKMVTDLVTLNDSYKKMKDRMTVMQKLESEGRTKEAELVADQILAIQAINAFKSATTENLIKNYKEVSENEKFTQEVRDAATRAIVKIQSYEQSYNKALKYQNAEDVFMNSVNQELIEEQINDATTDYIETHNKLLAEKLNVNELTLNDKWLNELSEDAHPELKKKGEYLQKLNERKTQIAERELTLKSREYQRSAVNERLFNNELAKKEIQLRKDFKKQRKNGFDLYQSKEYKEAFDNTLKKYEGKLNDDTIEAIKTNYEIEKKSAELVNKITERGIIQSAEKGQEAIAKIKGISADNAPQEDRNAVSNINQIVDDSPDLFDPNPVSNDPKMISDDLSDNQKETLKNEVMRMYGNLKNTISNPTIEDLVRYHMTLSSAKQTETNLDALVKGWKYANLPQAENINTNDLFNSMFKRTGEEIISEFTDFVESLPTDLSPEEQAKIDEQDRQAEQRTQHIQNKETLGSDKSGNTVTNPSDRLDTPNATLAHKSNAVVENYEEGEGVTELTHKKINDLPNMSQSAPHQNKILFHDKIKVGTELHVEVAEDYMEQLVKTYDKKGQPQNTMTFGEWLTARNAQLKKEGKPALSPDSQEYRDKIPMVVKDADGDIIALMHDVNRISEFHNTKGTINKAQENTRRIRNAGVKKGGTKVVVTNKSLGHILPYLKEPVKLKDADPTAILALSVSGGKLEFKREGSGINAETEVDQIIYSEGHPRKGELYELRRVGVTANGDPKFFAFKANRPTVLTEDIQNGLYEFLETFINKDVNRKKFDAMSSMLFARTKSEIDIRSKSLNNLSELDKYLGMFVHVSKPSSVLGTTEHKIRNTVENIVNRKRQGSAPSYFIFSVDGKIVVGEAFAGNVTLSMESLKMGQLSGGDEAIQAQNDEFLAYLKDFALPNMRVDISKDRLDSAVPVPILKNGKWENVGNTYHDFLRNTFETTNPARQVQEKFGDETQTEYVSFVQPTVEIGLTEATEITDNEYFEQIQKNELDDTTARKIAEKIDNAERLTAQEEELKRINPNKVKSFMKKSNVEPSQGELIEFDGEMITMEEFERRINEENDDNAGLNKYLNDDESLDPKTLEDKDIQDIKNSQHTIKGLYEADQRHIVEFIFNNVAGLVKIDKGKVVNIEEVRKTIKKLFNDYTSNLKEETQKKYTERKAAYEKNIENKTKGITDEAKIQEIKDKFKNFKTNYELLGEKLNRLNIITNNWEIFEEEAINMSKKYLEIANSKAVANEPDSEMEDMEERVEQEDSKTPEFDKTAEEINHKERVSADVRVFCQGIQALDANGKPIVGTFGTPVYVGFDTIFDTVSALLADKPSNKDMLIQELEDNKDAHNWIPDFLEKFENAPESLQNEIVRHMTKHALDMEFVMFSKNRDGSYSLKIYSTNSAAIIQNLKTRWRVNARNSAVMDVNDDGEYIFSKAGINRALREYEALKGDENGVFAPSSLVKEVLRPALERNIAEMGMMPKEFYDSIKGNTIKKLYLSKEELARILHFRDTTMTKDTKAKMIFKQAGKTFEMRQDGNSNAIILREYEQERPSITKLKDWLSNFGIEISDQTAFEIMYQGFRYDKNTVIPFNQQWEGEKSGEGKSLLGVLAGTIENIRKKMDSSKDDVLYDEQNIDGDKLLSQSIIDALAVMEARHTEHRIVQSFYDNKKVLYGFTITKYITDRINQIRRKDPDLINSLKNTSYNKHSFWLDMLESDERFADSFRVKHLGKTALKEQGKKIYRDNALQALSLIDHELVKLGMFMPLTQGDVKHNKEKYQGLKFRIARMFSPTMSDKSTSTVIKTAVLDFDDKLMDSFENTLEFMYKQLIVPDMDRISNFNRNIKSTNVKSYDKGAKLFYGVPQLNNLKVPFENNMVSLSTLLETKGVDYIENKPEIKEVILNELKKLVEAEQAAKLQQWEEGKFITKGEDGKYSEFQYLDKYYIQSRAKSGTVDDRVRIAAMDYVINSMVATANSMMVVAGDPAQYYKKEDSTEDTDHVQIVKDTFLNVGKRLANQIAPGDKLADSDVKNNTYLQLMMNDVFSISENIKMIVKINDNKEISDAEITDIRNVLEQHGDKAVKNRYGRKFPKSIDFLAIESTNAQEYTTWKEHLYVLEKMGKSTDASIGVTQEDIDEARKIFTNEVKFEDLTERQRTIVNKIVQPMKPVYTGQIRDEKSDLMRTVYIKTSSFPLIPQLTAGLELDKLRESMENIEKSSGKTVRASFSSGNKVGSLARPMVLANSEGTFDNIHKLTADQLAKFTLELPRSGFRIQQNVPFKSALTDEDIVTLGTQTVKLLFGNGVMGMSNFDYNGQKMSGAKLHQEFFKNFNNLVSQARNNLFKEIGIDPYTGDLAAGVNLNTVNRKLSGILQNEAVLRGFPRQDIEALGIDPATGDFKLPLWLSPNAVKYEALLTAIVSHRIAKIKFPGYSYVAGSENGFKVRTDEDFDVKKNGSQIVFTDAWTGKLQPHQALVQSKFRVDGKLIDLIKDGYAKEVDGKWMLDTDKIDSEMLNLPSFRIPTSKHSSMENVEIAGFLPSNSADLMIVSKDGTVAMGEDYDVDKRFTYNLWTTVEDGKIIPVDKRKEYQDPEYIDREMARLETEIQANRDAARRYKNIERKIQKIYDRMDIAVKGDMEVDTAPYQQMVAKLEKEFADRKDSDIEQRMSDLIDTYNRLKKDKMKIVQNNIVRIHQAVLSHDMVKELMSQKLSVDEAANDAAFLEKLTSQETEYFTPFSDRYQQQKVMSGAIGKIGTAAYSLDVVAQSLFEQAHMNGDTIQLMQEDAENEGVYKPVSIKIGKIRSDGKLGQQLSFNIENGVVKRNGRAIADVHSERQNLMVDNEKEQIAIRVNLNDHTMRVDKVLNMLGFDKGEAIIMEDGLAREALPEEKGDKYSVSFLFISQPIIKEYVEMMEAENSNTAIYDPKRQEKVIEALLMKYGIDTEEDINYDEEMTNVNLINAILNNGEDKALQAAVLQKFIELNEYGKTITTVQTSMNIDSKGVGKNLFEVTEKQEALLNLFDTESKVGSLIQNADKLIGDYHKAITKEEMITRAKMGYIVVREDVLNSIEPKYHMIQPNTVVGTYAVNALTTANRLWGRFFPYNENTVQQVFSEIFNLIGNSDLSEARTVEIKRIAFNEMKKYLVTDQELDYFTLTPQQERYRLFFDSVKGKGDKKSLASYLKQQLARTDYAGKMLRSNRLINRLNFEINSNGKPSLIKLDNAIGQNFDETYIYDSIIELIDENVKLDEFQGKAYTTLDLAQDLVLYAYMEGGVQQAVQFIKYIPVSYIKKLGIDKLWNRNYKNFNDRNLLDTKNDANKISTFSRQFIQHNPELAKRVTPEELTNAEEFQVIDELEKGNLASLRKFKYGKLNDRNKHFPFLSIYNEKLPKGESKFQLYAYMEDENGDMMYIRIPVYGQFGMDEYSAKATGYISLVNQPHFPYPFHVDAVSLNNADVDSTMSGKYNIQNGDVRASLNEIAEANVGVSSIAKFLLKAMPSDITLEVDDINARGRFKNNTITIDRTFFLNPKTTNEEVATTFVREAVHAVTNNLISKYITEFNKETKEFKVAQNAPAYIKKLYALFKETVNELNKNGELDTLITKVDALKGGSQDVEGLTPEEYKVTYAGYDIFEFVERMLTSPELQRRMNEVKFKNTDKTLLDKLYDFIDSVLDALAKQLGLQELKKDNITAQSFDAIYAMINDKIEHDNALEKSINHANNLLKNDMTESEFQKMQDEIEKQQGNSFENLLDENGNINDEPFSSDPLLIANFDTIKAATANMIKEGRLKVKCR